MIKTISEFNIDEEVKDKGSFQLNQDGDAFIKFNMNSTKNKNNTSTKNSYRKLSMTKTGFNMTTSRLKNLSTTVGSTLWNSSLNNTQNNTVFNTARFSNNADTNINEKFQTIQDPNNTNRSSLDKNNNINDNFSLLNKVNKNNNKHPDTSITKKIKRNSSIQGINNFSKRKYTQSKPISPNAMKTKKSLRKVEQLNRLSNLNETQKNNLLFSNKISTMSTINSPRKSIKSIISPSKGMYKNKSPFTKLNINRINLSPHKNKSNIKSNLNNQIREEAMTLDVYSLDKESIFYKHPKKLNLMTPLNNTTINKKMNKTINIDFRNRIKHVSNLDFVNSKLIETDRLLKIKKDFYKLPATSNLLIPAWKELIDYEDDNYKKVINDISVSKLKGLGGVNNPQQLKELKEYKPKSKVNEFINQLNNKAYNRIVGLENNKNMDDNKLKSVSINKPIKNNNEIEDNVSFDKKSNSAYSVSKASIKRKTSIRKAHKKIVLPPKSIYMTSTPYSDVIKKDELVNKLKLDNYEAKDIKKINLVKDKHKQSIDIRDEEEEVLVPNSNNDFEYKYKIIKDHNKFRRSKNLLGSFNDYLIRNFIFSERRKGPLEESRRQWNLSDNFFKQLERERKTKLKEKFNNDNINSDVKEEKMINQIIYENISPSESYSLNELQEKFENNKNNKNTLDIPMHKKARNSTFLFQESIGSFELSENDPLYFADYQKKQIKKMDLKRAKYRELENNKLIEDLLDISDEYEELREPLIEDHIISEINLRKLIKRREIEKKFVNPMRKFISVPHNVIKLRSQKQENMDFQSEILGKMQFVPSFLNTKIKGKTAKRFKLVNGVNYGIYT